MFPSTRSTLAVCALAAATGLSALAPASVAQPVPGPPARPEDGEITRLVNANSGKCLEISDFRRDNGAPAQQWDCVGVPSQNWRWQLKGSRWVAKWQSTVYDYTIRNVHSGKCLEISDSRRDNGAPAQQWDCTPDAPGQIWTVTAPQGRRAMIWNRHSGKVLEIAGSSLRNGARAQQWSPSGDLPKTMVWHF